MILYFANRTMDILGHASTNLPEGFVIIEDSKTEEIETGVATFTCKIGFDADNREQLEAMTDSGNYILRKNGLENEFYTIIDTEIDTKSQEIYVYAEDAGLDLLNEIAEAYEATEAHTAEWYVNKWIVDSGFEIGINEIPSTTVRTLKWDGESTVTERLASIATQFGGFEVAYSFDIKGTTITNKYVNIYAKRGSDNGAKLRLNYDIDRIVIKKSVANLATALRCTGGTPEDAEEPITLKGYEYDDGDFFVGDDGILRSRNANAKWSRYVWNKEPNKLDGYTGHIVRSYSYDTTSQATLCAHAVTELKSICDMEVNFEVDINKLPENIKVGDRIDIIDDAGNLYLSSRILLLETSVTNNTQTATIGEHLIKDDGISMKVQEIAAQFAESAKDAERARLLAEAAKATASEAQTQVEQAASNLATAEQNLAAVTSRVDATEAEIAEAQAAVEEARKDASNAETMAAAAQSTANTAKTEASNAAKVATNYIDFVTNTGLVIGDMTASTLGKNVLIDSDSVCIRNGSTVLASFEADLIELGKNSKDATISFCNGKGLLAINPEDELELSSYRNRISSIGNLSSSVISSYFDYEEDAKTYYMSPHIGTSCHYDSSGTYAYKAQAYSGMSAEVNSTSGSEGGIAELYARATEKGSEICGNADKIQFTGREGLDFQTEGAIIFNATSGLVLPNSQRLYSADANGINREIMRLNADADPILIIGDGLYSGNIGAAHVSAGKAVRLLIANERVILEEKSGEAYSAQFRPHNDNQCALGTANRRFYGVWAGNSTIQTSDAREKENILPLGVKPLVTLVLDETAEQIDIHSELFDKLRPVQYNFIEGNTRTCYGLIAQDVISAMEELGIGENDLDLVYHEFHADEETGEEKETFGLAYNNLIAMLIHEVQKLKTEVAALKAA